MEGMFALVLLAVCIGAGLAYIALGDGTHVSVDEQE